MKEVYQAASHNNLPRLPGSSSDFLARTCRGANSWGADQAAICQSLATGFKPLGPRGKCKHAPEPAFGEGISYSSVSKVCLQKTSA